MFDDRFRDHGSYDSPKPRCNCNKMVSETWVRVCYGWNRVYKIDEKMYSRPSRGRFILKWQGVHNINKNKDKKRLRCHQGREDESCGVNTLCYGNYIKNMTKV